MSASHLASPLPYWHQMIGGVDFTEAELALFQQITSALGAYLNNPSNMLKRELPFRTYNNIQCSPIIVGSWEFNGEITMHVFLCVKRWLNEAGYDFAAYNYRHAYVVTCCDVLFLPAR
jgi:hypothetical protein